MTEAQSQSIEVQVATLPKKPGVYLMKDQKGEVIYVGKAKHLRKRVKNYFSGSDDRASVPYIVKRVADIEVIVTESEQHAFVLERDLITKYKPRYNIRLKDDKAYLHVRIDRNKDWPHLELVRRVQQDGADYFGPYTFSYELRTVLDLIKKVVPLRTCRDAVLYNRQRPCLEYQIKRCAGPCCLEVSKEEYGQWVNQAISILKGETSELREDLVRSMELAAEDLRFEDAARYRDKLDILEQFGTRQSYTSSEDEDRDVFAFYREETLAVLTVLRVRGGRIQGSDNFCLSQVEVSSEEVLESSIIQYYRSGREIPGEVLLPFEIEGTGPIHQELKELRGGAVNLAVPKRGIKFRVLGLAGVNAKEHFIAKFDREKRYQEVAESLARILGLKQMPRRIECIDISNLQGSSIVGAVVSFYDGEPDKARYRKYKISLQGKPDDFASVEEVVRRRLKSKGDADLTLPDLLIIDGGKGQLERALIAADEARVVIDIVGLAKIRDADGKKRSSGARGERDVKFERLFLPGRAAPIPLDPSMESTRFLQRIRDEAHRFVIEYHRATRAKETHRSKLDGIDGVGPKRRQKLLEVFGSVKKIAESSSKEIAEKAGMPLGLAARVKNAVSSK